MDQRSVFALTPDELRQRFERAFDLECDLDPMILRARLLRQRGLRCALTGRQCPRIAQACGSSA